MIPYKTLIVINKNTGKPVYRQIAAKLIDLIRGGTLKPGTALPSSREMALLLNVHRKTIVAAYEELYVQDWTETAERKRVTVSLHLPETKPRTFKSDLKQPAYAGNPGFTFTKKDSPFKMSKVDKHHLIINDGFPDSRLAPVDMLAKEYKRLFKNEDIRSRIIFGGLTGSFNLREAMAGFLSDTRALNITSSNILISRGGQMAIYLAAGIILKPGSRVIVGEPNYNMANEIFERWGAKLVKVAVDENGIDVDAIEKICKKKRPDLLYIIPHHHHPTTVTLSANRRMKLLHLIREFKLPVIEDDYDYDFHYSSSPILPLASADHDGNVIYIGSLTKAFNPTIKVGYMVATEDFIHEAANLRKLIDIKGDHLMEEALAVLVKNGDMYRHIKKSVKLYHERRDLFCDLLKKELGNDISFTKPAGGMALWAKFNRKNSLPAVSKKASAQGLFMSDGSFYNSVNINYNALRMGFASLNVKEIEEVISILKRSAR